MISATVILVLMIVALLITMMGIVFAITSILLNYTGRSKSYDRAAIKMSKANDPKPAKAKKSKEQA
jgi:biopolymer transport protein ExbB/TolQ